MAFKPNYGLQRADRARAREAKREEKQRQRQERSDERKAVAAAAAQETDSKVHAAGEQRGELGKD